ncbi:MAG: dienelactone hydrolase family protein [Bacteroidetes bacterium]|nr:dienelactone hydrolase family protein [Bacteroidota bacterium]
MQRSHSMCQKNVSAALDYLVQNNLSKTLVVFGFSKGAGLGFEIINQRKDVVAFIEFYGDVPGADSKDNEIRKATENLPPLLIIHGEKDKVVAVKKANKIYSIMSNNGNTVEKLIIPKVGHAFPLSKDINDLNATETCKIEIEIFLKKHL